MPINFLYSRNGSQLGYYEENDIIMALILRVVKIYYLIFKLLYALMR